MNMKKDASKKLLWMCEKGLDSFKKGDQRTTVRFLFSDQPQTFHLRNRLILEGDKIFAQSVASREDSQKEENITIQ